RLSTRNFDYSADQEKIKKVVNEKIANNCDISEEDASLGIIKIANSNMLNALKLISIRKGHNPKDFSLVAFGGGGSMHATSLAKELGIKKVIIPIASPVFSAWGMLMSELRHDYIQTYIKKIAELTPENILEKWSVIEEEAYSQFANEGVGKERIIFKRFLDMRYIGQEHTVKVPVPNGKYTEETFKQIQQEFHKLHEQNYSFKLPDIDTEIVNLHVTAFGSVQKPQINKISRNTTLEKAKIETRDVYFDNPDVWKKTNVYNRGLLPVNEEISGPVIIEE